MKKLVIIPAYNECGSIKKRWMILRYMRRISIMW